MNAQTRDFLEWKAKIPPAARETKFKPTKIVLSSDQKYLLLAGFDYKFSQDSKTYTTSSGIRFVVVNLTPGNVVKNWKELESDAKDFSKHYLKPGPTDKPIVLSADRSTLWTTSVGDKASKIIGFNIDELFKFALGLNANSETPKN